MSYVQYVYHFPKRDSIDVRTITKDDIDWCLDILSYNVHKYPGTLPETQETITKMLETHFPEYLL
jgi:hypothetical protein